ncbi:MAG: glycosyltransferase family 4 protein [Methanomassiliicoccales archaeon]|jgi:glycosyltransferase involved in cell wall biosynthesis|nr:glycosyltransferase family 4 protein [Methanomassiliicoccales archaeon]
MDKNKLKEKYNLCRFDNIILFAERLSEVKNLKLLLESFALVENTLEDIALVIAGRGDKEWEIKLLSQKMDIKNVILTGEVSPEKMPEIYNCADVVALTSWYEASPTVVKEALACGVPVVSTNVGDVSEIITDPQLGTVVDEYDEKLFADALIKTIEMTKAIPEEVRKKCREIALERFGFNKVAKEFLAVYEKAMTMRGAKIKTK